MPRSAIPDFGTDYPAWTGARWPKHVGYNEAGEPLTAQDQAEYDLLKEEAVLPRVLGKDKNGNDVVANTPRDVEWLAAKVVKPSVPAVPAADTVNALTPAAKSGTKSKAA